MMTHQHLYHQQLNRQIPHLSPLIISMNHHRPLVTRHPLAVVLVLVQPISVI